MVGVEIGEREVGVGDVGDGAGELAGGGVGVGAEGVDEADLVGGAFGSGGAGDAFGEDADCRFVFVG
jgi:hypothetical protein